ncbi:biopolymer transporter ExbD [uncultured Mucilaginibacter sp.]|uniref:ExbD/TolR family protein n=1 Tax=uncultured Mucilaginibacter sp. TaxID=797541 RepID=UPI0025D161FF|nr:biopolymer transporter ExbD [uncultured Mucilaginibacter sp.]
MPRVKVARKSTAIDMTAMCDVAFLLLTFFILTAKPKIDDPSHAEVPPSSYMLPLKDANMITIAVGVDKAFFSVTEQDVRAGALKAMGEKYGVTFTAEETQRFSLVPIFGVPMKQLKSFLDTEPTQVKNFPQTGIPVDTTNNNELFNWIYTSRQAEKALHDKDLQVSIKADKAEKYPMINTVISVLEKQKLFKFDLITTLATAPKK